MPAGYRLADSGAYFSRATLRRTGVLADDRSMAADYAWPERRNRERPRATYELNVYLVPERPTAIDARDWRDVLSWLERERIVGCYFDEGLGWLAPGERSAHLFADARPGELGFEYLIPYWGATSQFVPNAHTGRFGATCASCGGDIDEALHEFIQRGAGDASTDTLMCRCGERTRVAQLDCAIDTVVTPAYLNFCHVNSGELRSDAQRAIESHLGGPIRVVRERL